MSTAFETYSDRLRANGDCPECRGSQAGPRRALLAIRLSNMTDETTSPERQRLKGEQYAQFKDWTVVGAAVDLDVSATRFAPIDRPELGGWMRQRHTEFDVIVFWKLDRAVRRPEDLTALVEWCRVHNKSLVFVDDGFDLDSPLGKAMAYMAAVFAEMEASRLSERVRSYQAWARTNTRWPGGQVPYGFRAVPHPDGSGKALEVDPDTAGVVRQFVSWLVDDGMSLRQVAARLNAQGVPPPSARTRTGRPAKKAGTGRWQQAILSHICRRATLLGQKVSQGRVQRDESGMPIQMAEPIISQETYDRLQTALGKRRQTRERRQGTSPWLGVAYCARCEGRLYLNITRKSSADGTVREYAAYRCMTEGDKMGCHRSGADVDRMNAVIEDLVARHLADVPVVHRVWVPGNDTSAEVERISRNLTVVRSEYDNGAYAYPTGENDYQTRTANLIARLKAMSDQPHQPAGWINEETGETFGEAWRRLDQNGKRTILLEAGVKVFADKHNDILREFIPKDLIVNVQRASATYPEAA